MKCALESSRQLTDDALIARVKHCVAGERRATAALIEALAELDVRRLYLGQGFASLFDYCTRHLHLSERATCSRIAAARLARRFPIVLDLIAGNRVSLTAVSLLAKHLNESNYLLLLQEATHKTTHEVEVIVARISPQPDAKPMVRRITSAAEPLATMLMERENETAATASPPARPQLPAAAHGGFAIKPLAPERFRVQFTISGETQARLRVTQDLLRHSIPTGDLAAIFDRALSALLADLEKKKLAIVAKPRAAERRPTRVGSRSIPAAVRRAVWARDKGRCAFKGSEGRCPERGRLELHHVKPFAAGGEATIVNIELRCRAHNQHEADVYVGN